MVGLHVMPRWAVACRVTITGLRVVPWWAAVYRVIVAGLYVVPQWAVCPHHTAACCAAAVTLPLVVMQRYHCLPCRSRAAAVLLVLAPWSPLSSRCHCECPRGM